ncbi:MAG: hypothetical protein AABY44_01705, partial [Nitrospirota bacterium]
MKRHQTSDFRLQVSKFVIYILLILTSHFLLLTSLFAEEKIEIGEVVVTATRIEEALEDIP